MKNQPPRFAGRCAAVLALGLSCAPASAGPETAQSTNPISRVARIFNRKLVEVEDRLSWLQRRLNTLAPRAERPLKEQLGWRCGRDPEAKEAPWVTLGFHAEVPLGDIYLIPAQIQPGESMDLFPRRFTVEAATEADFSDARVVFDTGTGRAAPARGYPFHIRGDGAPARHLRFIWQEGHQRGMDGVCALSEIFVFSGDEPVSLNAEVLAGQSVDVPGMWEPGFLVDGRTPLGHWEGGLWSTSRGDCLEVPLAKPTVEWVVDLEWGGPVDRIVLFPYALPELSGPGVIPPRFHIETSDCPTFEDPVLIATSGERDLPVDMSAPLVIRTEGKSGRYLRVVSEKAWRLGNRHLQALGEIEVWSAGKNLAAGRRISVRHNGLEHTTQELTDGSSNGLQILPMRTWLAELVDRALIEREIESLRPTGIAMAQESEINTAWGAAIALGLTFLIPVAIIERRRLISKSQLDQLRKRIASDLHDDIGSNLGSLSLIARSAKRDLQRLKGPDEIAEDLGEMELIARESSLAMRDIVWLLERRQDTIGDLVQRMRDSASRLLRDVEYSVVCRSSRTTAKLTLDAKRHLFLFYKEALHNIVKHSGATEVSVRLFDSRDRLVMEIRDNGKGLPLDDDGKPRGVAKITDRARVLEGSLDIESTPAGGTSLRLTVKRSSLIARKSAAYE